MTSVKFTKLQGAGNDFVLIDARELDLDWPTLAERMCDRHFGVGADGLLLVLPSTTADLQLRMFNPDGTEAEACGNGLRCFVRYARDEGLVQTDAFAVETKAGTRAVRISDRSRIQVAMGGPILNPSAVPVVLESREDSQTAPVLDHHVSVEDTMLSMGFVSMGNPHAVCFLNDSVTDFPLHKIGPVVEHHRMFPNRVNFEVANVVSRSEIRARVWERGAGETLACGSGICAVAVIARLKGLIEMPVDVRVRGGTLTVDWDGSGEVLLTGPAEFVFSGIWEPKAA